MSCKNTGLAEKTDGDGDGSFLQERILTHVANFHKADYSTHPFYTTLIPLFAHIAM